MSGQRFGTLRLLVRAVEHQIDVMATRGQQSNDGIEVPQVPRVVHDEEEAPRVFDFSARALRHCGFCEASQPRRRRCRVKHGTLVAFSA